MQKINYGETPNKVPFVKNVQSYVNDNPTLRRFFKDDPGYIQEFAKKVTELTDDRSTPLGSADLLPKTIMVTLHQQVIYCGMPLQPVPGSVLTRAIL